VKTPETTPFSLYNDFTETGIKNSSYATSADLNYYSTVNPFDGKYCIEWNNAKQYDFIEFDFIHDKDLSLFAALGSEIHLSLMVKGNTPNSVYDIRFVDTKTDVPEDHPWRIRYTVKENENIKWDNQWHKLEIPLAMFQEQGSWDNNQWYNPIGDFDWTNVDKFEIVSESQDLSGKDFAFDNIKFVDITTAIDNNNLPTEFLLNQNFPNPFNPNTTVNFSLPQNGFVTLKVYDVLGREVATLINQQMAVGYHRVDFNASHLTSGIYFYKLEINEFVSIKKMLLMK
jgi:hypothetical protein